ncbi:MAG TPA: hypothetical protein VEL74_05780, partial [Thermoanaerobaculia bacterium]|nr:hypothetical protein [Thermoanaerobaculia bacterium]
PAPGGWVVRARWSVLPAEGEGDGAFRETFPQEPPFGRAADLAIEVVDQDGGQEQPTVLTTGLEGKDGASILLLDADPGAPGLFEMLKIKGC